ncbi:hypothetical protein S40285_04914 [Stachybotrys chlorohalonatus IBT 40285]|uniref:Uncharacterized protein n=1 Tax=Stachybotrys chlorohalonatus (strain IBT 40285) TaxID=1283841 RepID=A0A084QGZ2_STAC4|nr:hypothetical protein S40285_04914 [Stachybotrys chlorohalonata IBT 40285]
MADSLHPDNEQARLNPLGQVMAQFAQYGQNASNNIQSTFKSMTIQGWLRLVIIVGGYMLLRPYLLQLVTKGGVSKLQEQEAKEKAEVSANEFRGVKEKLEEHDEEDAEEDTGESSGNWGQQARVRQRKVIRQLLEAEEKRRQEEEEDKDIEEFLVD